MAVAVAATAVATAAAAANPLPLPSRAPPQARWSWGSSPHLPQACDGSMNGVPRVLIRQSQCRFRSIRGPIFFVPEV